MGQIYIYFANTFRHYKRSFTSCIVMSEADTGSCLCVSENSCKCVVAPLVHKNLTDYYGQCFPLLMLLSLLFSATWCHLLSPFVPLEWSQPCVLLPPFPEGESGLSLLPCPSGGQRKASTPPGKARSACFQ